MLWDLRPALDEQRGRGLYRRPRAVEGTGAVRGRLDGRDVVVFCSNDYLGLAAHPRITEAFEKAARRHGVGSGAAHLVSGHRTEHEALERELADWLGRDRALLFSTGYMANLGAVAALMGRGDAVVEDRLNHASLLDAARLSGARLLRYRHADTSHLRERLDAAPALHRLVVTDGVFSMDGDIAPLDALAAEAQAENTALMVDDAHGLGVVGPEGRGSVAAAGLSQAQVPVLVGTLGKAFGTFGAFVAGSEALIETLIQKARTYIYTTAPPPAVAAATRESLRLIREEGWRRDRLDELVRRFRHGADQLGLRLMNSSTPIQPVLVGEAATAVRASRALEAAGLLVTAIRPPTVPEGTARLRVTLCAEHGDAEVDRLLEVLGGIDGLQHGHAD